MASFSAPSLFWITSSQSLTLVGVLTKLVTTQESVISLTWPTFRGMELLLPHSVGLLGHPVPTFHSRLPVKPVSSQCYADPDHFYRDPYGVAYEE